MSNDKDTIKALEAQLNVATKLLDERKDENERLTNALSWFVDSSDVQVREARAVRRLPKAINPDCPYRNAIEALKEAES